jgi:predicted transcriptional regulator
VNGNGHTAPHALRKSILELAPLECDCMNALWLLGQGTVRDIRDAIAPTRPRAYTTIMTIMDRLAHKGVVTRRKSGRAFLYAPNLSAEEARARAVGQLVESYFGGSQQALLAHLGEASAEPPRLALSSSPAPARRAVPREARIDETLL